MAEAKAKSGNKKRSKADTDSGASAEEKAIKPKPRIHIIDELRGFAIFCMVFFHAFFTVGFIFDLQWGQWLYNFFVPAEPYFAGLFILISGVACNLSHSNLERGVKLALIALAVTLVTYLAKPLIGEENLISFGILHMLACGMLLYGLINKYLKLIPCWIGIVVNVLLFILTYTIRWGRISVPFLFSIKLPQEMYSTPFLFMFGLPDKNFISSDYFPLLPWIFMFFAGTFLGRIGIKKKFPKFMFKKRIGFFGFLGRHSLIIYLAHQPIILGICYLVQWIISLFPHGT